MNSKTIIKRTLPLIIALVVIIILAVSCSIFTKNKKDPSISDPDGIFLTAGDITITRSQIFKQLKKGKGLEEVMLKIDRELLGREKNANGVSFLNGVSEDKIDEVLEEAMFPNGRSKDEDENTKTIETWEQNMRIGYGLRSEAEIRDYYRLVVAKEDYALAKVTEAYLESIANNDPDDEDTLDDDTITNEAIDTYYKNNYKDSHFAIIVPYNTEKEAKAALSQIGIEIKEKTKDKFSWYWGSNGEELNDEEIKQAFIDLYNNAYAYKAPGYPNTNPLDNIVLNEKYYSVVEGKIVFNLDISEDEDEALEHLLYFTEKKLADTYGSSSIVDKITNLSLYDEEKPNFEKTFTIQSVTVSSKNYYILRIAVVDKVKQSAVKDEIIDALLAQQQDKQEKTLLNELRKENNLIIYDSAIESSYISSYDAKHPKTKKDNSSIVASIDGLDLTIDELFDALAKKYGVLMSIDLFSNEFILLSEYNTIYDYVNKKILDQEKWNDITEQVDDIKQAFKSNAYYNYGYPVSYGWENFLKNYFAVNNSEELKIRFLREVVEKEFIDEITKTEDLWDEIYQVKMQENFDKYLRTAGVHLLISKTDEDGEYVHPDNWSDYERAVAEEFYNMVLSRLQATLPSKYQTLLENTIVGEFKNAPKFVANLDQDAASQPVYSPETPWILIDSEDYLYSKLKSAGFEIVVQTLEGTDSAGVREGDMVPEFEAALRAIWDRAEANDDFGSTPIIYDKTYGEYIVTKFGYHVYVNTKTYNRPTITVSSKDVVVLLPSKAEVLAYEKNDADPDLTKLVVEGITQYYKPINSEVKGNHYVQAKLNEYYLANSGIVVYADASLNANGELAEIFTYDIKTSYSNLVYINNPYDAD